MDAISLQVIHTATEEIIHQLTVNMLKTGYSTIIKEQMDVTFAVLNNKGQVVGQYFVEPIHLGVIGGQIGEIIERYKGDINENDCFIVNHPYQRCQNHSTDVTLISPIFYEGEHVGFVGNTAHKPDLGGKVPGTNAGDSTDSFQDGLLIPPLKLYDRGKLDNQLYQIIICNTRTPEITWGDTRAQAFTNLFGVKKITELMNRYGKEDVIECWDRWIEICEAELRKAISKIPDGTYGPVTDWMDDDGLEPFEPYYITVTLRKQADELHFTVDSEKEARGPINLRPCLTRCIIEYCVKAALLPSLPNNSGISEPIKITFPDPGHLLNPVFPASVNMYAMTCARLSPIVMMVLAQCIPDKVPAPASGAIGAISFAGGNPRTGRWYSEYEILAGGYGARPTKDGPSAMDFDGSNTMNTPVEAVETEFPAMITRYELIQDSGGAGQFRGGLGVRRIWKPTVDNVTLNIRSDRFKFSSPGIFGAKPARPSSMFIKRGEDEVRKLRSKASGILLKKGDEIIWELGGGGGWGNPMKRDPKMVLDDVRAGYVSIDKAKELYGVVLDSDNLMIK